jgi:hypothetical protein
VRLYRALHHDPKAASDQPGGLLYVPPQGNGRIDNPEAYRVFYVGDTRAGVCAEVFNWGKYRRQWSADMLRPPPFLPVSHRAIAWYDVEDETLICNLDDPRELLAQSLRPSTVITRNYAESQKWALRLFQQGKWRGLRWWSYHDARWASIGIWDLRCIRGYGSEPLSIDDEDLAEAARVLQIRVMRTKRHQK